ncbi:hypothetical protein M6D81_11875 [Paenibacillus sp. J5C_2022]|uniref:hypothetical protein n=1 Tax=Paenibacillus sp. J5C2022 TaxID=2977129 RepID=UPI0021D15FA9|nr:hypothetical protein [Paenibacillus sp. J5C2022]MCU6709403.1 hypothetical protein [Paenibacillus sp. J5C2022]
MFKIKDKGLSEWGEAMALMEKEMPKQSKQLLRRVGTVSRQIVARKAKQLVKRKSGTYHKSIKRGKIWTENGQLLIRVYSKAPHKFLIELGHRIVGKDGTEHGFKPGLKVFEKAGNEIEDKYDQLIEQEFDRLMHKLK